jgi:hypothetical protein
MTREEVIRGLKKLHENYGWVAVHDCDCKTCPYERVNGCYKQIIEDALTLLREQEPVAPKLQSGGNYVCGNCGMYTVGFVHPLTGESVQTWKYCGKCGKKVRWDG